MFSTNTPLFWQIKASKLWHEVDFDTKTRYSEHPLVEYLDSLILIVN